MRIKYADQPEKFMESELDLDEEVQRLLAVAGSPELYPDFVKTGVVENLMNLLSHENTDIAADVLELFQQLTDADIIEDSVCSGFLLEFPFTPTPSLSPRLLSHTNSLLICFISPFYIGVSIFCHELKSNRAKKRSSDPILLDIEESLLGLW